MTRAPAPVRRTRPSLRSVLRRAHFGVALLAVVLAGLTLTIAGFVVLHVYASNNLQLIATSMSYTVEAAVVFDDRAAAEEAVALIASPEEVAEATILDPQGRVLADWQRPPGGSFEALEQRMADLVFPGPVLAPISHDGAEIGVVRLRGSAVGLLRFLALGIAVVLACLGLSTVGALYLSRSLQSGIVGPLQTLADVAHAVRRDRAFGRRVPPAAIAELNQLGDDFNALLAELESWQDHLQRENASLAHQASHDSLTGLPNRAVFENRLDRAIRDAGRDGGRVAVLFLDSDRFKDTNDRLGHAAGDAVLVDVADRLRARLRPGDLVARLGGDEFAVLLAPLQEVAEALRIADDILDGMAEPIRLPDGETVAASLSIGIALFPDHARDSTNLIQIADSAMYLAKRLQPGSRRLAGDDDPGRPDMESRIA